MAGGGDRRPTQAERRERSARRLLDAATQLIADQGFTRTTLAQIGKQAGYSRGLVNERFGSKSDLIRILADEFQGYFAVDRLTPALAGRGGLDALLVTIETYLDAVATSGTLGRAYYELFGESLALIPEIHETFVEADRALRGLLERAVRGAKEVGDLPASVDARALASLVVAILRGVAMQWLRDPSELDLHQVLSEVRRIFELAFARPAARSI